MSMELVIIRLTRKHLKVLYWEKKMFTLLGMVFSVTHTDRDRRVEVWRW
jgi:hypothetical protein